MLEEGPHNNSSQKPPAGSTDLADPCQQSKVPENIFSGEGLDNDAEKKGEDETPEKEPQKTSDPATNTTTAATPDDGKNATSTEKVKTVVVKEDIPFEVKNLYTPALEGSKLEEAQKRVSNIQTLEMNKKRKETALNALESFVIDAQMKMDQDEYKECATEAQIQAILKACSVTSDWIYEDEANEAEAIVFEEKLEELKDLTNEVYGKHWEHRERPEALNALKSMINGSLGFLETAKNLTKDANPEKDVFTQKEIDNLEKAIKETVQWRDTEVEEQKKLALNEPIRLTVKALTDKMSYLDREVKYLVNKIKLWRPKTPPAPPKVKDETENKTAGEDSDTPSDGPQIPEPDTSGDSSSSSDSDSPIDDSEAETPTLKEAQEESVSGDNNEKQEEENHQEL